MDGDAFPRRCVRAGERRCDASACRGETFEHVDQPGGRLQHREALRKPAAAEGFVEQSERTLVGRMGARGVAEAGKAAHQFGATRFEIVIALAEGLARTCALGAVRWGR